MTDILRAHEFAVVIPPGWDVRITGTQAGPMGTVDYPVVHAANFALPGRREDFGGELVGAMSARQVFVALLGYGRQGAGHGLFEATGLPLPLRPDWFDPYQMQRPMSGKAGMQRFFTAYGRTFCLYVVLGDEARRAALVTVVNQFLVGVTIEPAGSPGPVATHPPAAVTHPNGAPATPVASPPPAGAAIAGGAVIAATAEPGSP